MSAQSRWPPQHAGIRVEQHRNQRDPCHGADAPGCQKVRVVPSQAAHLHHGKEKHGEKQQLHMFPGGLIHRGKGSRRVPSFRSSRKRKVQQHSQSPGDQEVRPTSHKNSRLRIMFLLICKKGLRRRGRSSIVCRFIQNYAGRMLSGKNHLYQHHVQRRAPGDGQQHIPLPAVEHPPPQQWRSAPARRGAPTARRCSCRQYTTSRPIMAGGRTFPRYATTAGGCFFSGNSQKGSHRVSWVPAATARIIPSVCKGVSVTGPPPLRCGPGGAVHPAALPAPAP